MEVDLDFDTGAACPANSLVEIRKLTLYVGITVQGGNSPVSEGNADVVQACRGDSVDVILSNPCVPVVIETREGFVFAECCSVGPFVNDSAASISPFGEQ